MHKPSRPAVELSTLSPYAVFFPSLFDLMLHATRCRTELPSRRMRIALLPNVDIPSTFQPSHSLSSGLIHATLLRYRCVLRYRGEA